MRFLNKLIRVGVIGLFSFTAFTQEKTLSITIDDVPNTLKYQEDGFHSILLDKLDSLEVPFTIFINEDKIYKTGFHDKNKALLNRWIKNDHALIGNHTYSHSRFSEVGFDVFVKDIEKGENLTKHYASKYDKEVKYFRFPFNDMGKDSIRHVRIRNYLKAKKYTIAPFTVESSDWMFDYVYRHYLDRDEMEKAKAIGELYVEKTIEILDFFDEMVESIYKRPIKHIYLCHDNTINADYLAEIIARLQKEGHQIVSFEESLADPIYDQEDMYYKKWGVSWLYRWMDTQKERVSWMKQEPDLSEIQMLYNEIIKK